MAAWYDEGLERRARAYDRQQGLLFILRFALLFALAAGFWTSGWSRGLAEGLQGRFDFRYGWIPVHLCFVAMSVFGYEAILFPLSVYADHTLERAHGRAAQEFGPWFRGYALTLTIEIGIVTVGFTGLYALMRAFPSSWWLPATGLYALLAVGLGEWGPSQLLPKVRPPVAASDSELEEELRRLGREANLEIEGLARWNFEHQEDLDDVCLTGRGRKVRAIYSAWAWDKLGRTGRAFAAARQMQRRRSGSALGVQGLQVFMAGTVFWGAERIAAAAALVRGHPGAEAPEAFPFLVVALFSLAAGAGMVVHAFERHLELNADRFALRHAGGKEALLECLRMEFEREPFAVEVPAWQEWLLRRRPSALRRLERAEEEAGAR